MGHASVDLQAGGDASEVILVALSDRAVAALMATSAKLGADAGVAAGPVGGGCGSRDRQSQGGPHQLFRRQGSVRRDLARGGVVTPRGVLNAAYCGVTVTLQDILVTRTVTNPHTAPLIEAMTRAAAGRRRVAEVR